MSPADPEPRRAVLSRDTDRAAERLQVSLWQRMSAGDKLGSAAAASMATLRLSLAGIRLRAPDADERVGRLALARLTLGPDLVRRLYSAADPRHLERMTIMDPVDVALRVAEVLEKCGVRYVVGGSLASSVNGEPRSTLDVDLMVDLQEPAVARVIDGLGDAFHAEPEAFARALRERSSLTVIHMATAIKVALFIMGATPIEAEQMNRRRNVQVADRPAAALYVYTPEDILLQKLRWYGMGRETFDRQWRDVLGIIVVQAGALDLVYLRDAAVRIGVSELLTRALIESGTVP